MMLKAETPQEDQNNAGINTALFRFVDGHTGQTPNALIADVPRKHSWM
jgi:hypothetical protein